MNSFPNLGMSCWVAEMADFILKEGEALCKVCGMPHPIDEWRGVKFYICPESERVYLVNKEKSDERRRKEQ